MTDYEAKCLGYELDSIDKRLDYLHKDVKFYFVGGIVVTIIGIIILIGLTLHLNTTLISVISPLITLLFSFGTIQAFVIVYQCNAKIKDENINKNEIIAKLELSGYCTCKGNYHIYEIKKLPRN